MNLDDASTQLWALCVPHLTRTQRPWRLALSGLPGSGKSTLAQALVTRARHEGFPALALSLDDFYLPRRTRAQLARHIHPLLATRGVPGTHDLALLRHVLNRLPQADDTHPVAVPRFDKGRDTRCPPSRWLRVCEAPRLLILEGWCLGVRAQSTKQLTRPVNALERDADPDGRWRTYANHRLADYLPLWTGADTRALLQVTRWSDVRRHRDRAEQVLRQRRAKRAMDQAQIKRFLQHYERIGRQALAVPPAHVDLTLPAHHP
ncbi:MAG TPA: kinase [Oleiagrimonas sp.]|nr:kinase [Oleiagrimonas sp.]